MKLVNWFLSLSKKKRIITAIAACTVIVGSAAGVGIGVAINQQQPEPVHTHSYSMTVEVVNPTCEEQGYTLYQCSCGETYTEYDGKTLGHEYGAWVSNEDGTHTKTCSHDSSHTVTEDCNGGTATCTEKATCKDCGAQYGTLKEHEYNQQNTDSKFIKSEATCTAKAVYYYSCDAAKRVLKHLNTASPKGMYTVFGFLTVTVRIQKLARMIVLTP